MNGFFMQKFFALALLATSLVLPTGEARSQTAPVTGATVAINRPKGVETQSFVRTELFFGTDKPDGTEVSEQEFRLFLEEKVTPKFPDGLTLLTGTGQFRGSDGVIVREDSFVLILLYPLETLQESSDKIERIRRAYRKRFQQESVLRVDDRRPVLVSF